MGHTEAAKEATLLLELAIARSRASGLADEETKARIRGALEKAKQEILRLEERSDDRAGPRLVLGVRGTPAPSRLTRRGKRWIITNGAQRATYHERRNDGSRKKDGDEP